MTTTGTNFMAISTIKWHGS